MKDTTTTFLNGSTPAATVPTAAVAAQPAAGVVGAKVESVPKAKRRSFTAAYKRRIVAAADECRKTGEIGALLRREGLYSSHLGDWRKQMSAGQLSGTQHKRRGREPKQSAEQKENNRLKRENARLEKELAQAELIIEAQKKVSELLNLLSQQRESQSL